MSVQETLPWPCGLERGEVGAGLVVGQVQARLGRRAGQQAGAGFGGLLGKCLTT